MHDILIPLGAMMVFYFLMVFIAVKLKGINGKSICPICATVSLTWIILLFLHFFEIWKVDLYFLSILMGASICGMMYLVEKKIESTIKKAVWKISSVIFGVFLVWGIISHQNWKMVLLTGIFYLGLILFFLKKKKGNREGGIAKNNSLEETSEKKNWLKKLENCC